MSIFEDYLLSQASLNVPVYAVLDGAQFDDLPALLFDAGLVGRSLYLDRGGNDAEQTITAPHLICPQLYAIKDTLRSVMEITAGGPSAVYWQCAAGEDRLYRHLRGINVVGFGKGGLHPDEQRHAKTDEVSALCRHADANAVAQIYPALSNAEAARFMGPASMMMLCPDTIWRQGYPYLAYRAQDDWPRPTPGLLSLSDETMARIETLRSGGLRAWARMEFGAMAHARIDAAFDRALGFGFQQKEDIWAFLELEQRYGPDFETRPECDEVRYILKGNGTAKQRIYYTQVEAEQALAALEVT